MNEYWTIKEPTISGDDKDGREYMFQFFRNGQVGAMYWLPFVICPECEGGGGGGKDFPFLCPERLKTHPAIVNGVPVPLKEYKELVPVVQEELERIGIDSRKWMLDPVLGFGPGSHFADRIIEIPCHPSVSFHWDFSNATVSKEVKETFEREKITGIWFQEVNINWVGKFDLAKKKPSWDHMMWWMLDGCAEGTPKDYPGEDNPSRFGPLYGMTILNCAQVSDIVPSEVYPCCETCGSELGPSEPIEPSEWRNFLTQNQLISYDMFRVPYVQGTVISDRVRRIIEENGFTNCQLTKLEVRE